MVEKKLQIQWTEQSIKSLKSIYEFHKKVSVIWANKIREEIFESPETISYSKQYQIDEYDPTCRRIVVGDYKILYQEDENVISIIDIVCALAKPKPPKK